MQNLPQFHKKGSFRFAKAMIYMKKTVSAFLCAVLIFTLFCVPTYAEDETEIDCIFENAGDATADGNVNSKDVSALLKYIAGNGNTVDENLSDVNRDAKVNSKDISSLLKFLAGVPGIRLGHVDAYTVEKEPTCIGAGVGSVKCTRCGDTVESTEIPPTGIHHFVRGICEVCQTRGEAYGLCFICDHVTANDMGLGALKPVYYTYITESADFIETLHYNSDTDVLTVSSIKALGDNTVMVDVKFEKVSELQSCVAQIITTVMDGTGNNGQKTENVSAHDFGALSEKLSAPEEVKADAVEMINLSVTLLGEWIKLNEFDFTLADMGFEQ